MSTQVNVRPATHADCDAIKAIERDLYYGLDRLLYCLHQDISMGTKFTYVMEINGQIVAYTCGHVIDDGAAIVMREGRTSDKYRGRNTIGKLNRVLIGAALAKFPNLKTLVWGSSNSKDTNQALTRNPYMSRTQLRPLERFITHADELKAVCAGDVFNNLKSKYQIDAIAAFPKRETLKFLTEEIRFLDFAPSRPFIGSQPSGWHVSTLGNQLLITDLFISGCPVMNTIQAFSFLTTTRSDYGLRTCLELYCHPKACSEDITIAHLLHFIREMATLHSDTKIISSFLYPPEVSEACVKDVLNVKLGISPLANIRFTSSLLEFKLSEILGGQSKL